MEHKLHNRILSALLALILVLTGFPVAAFAEGESTDVPERALCEVCGEEPCICMPEAEEDAADEDIETSADFAIFCDGLAVSTLELYRSEKRTVTAENMPEGCTYQWQIYVPGASFWVNISGQTDESLDLSFALLGNLLDEGDTALVRCAALCDGAVAETSGVLSVAVVDDPVEEEVSAEETPVEEAPAEEDPEIEPVDSVSEVVLGAVALADGAETVADEDVTYYTVTIEYVYSAKSKFDGQRVALPYIAEVVSGTICNATADSPNCVGYTPDVCSDTAVFDTDTFAIDLSKLGKITSNVSITVEYSPAEVSYTVRHYQQNVDDDEYTWVDTTMTTGYTEAQTSDSAAKTYTGFTALSHYREEIAADSSTMIDIYYDRNYYLMSFELDGGYGVTPVYARYGASVSVGTPTRAGYTFDGWEDKDGNSVTIPKTMPHLEDGSITYYAKWDAQGTEYSVVYWVNNDDGTKTYLTTRTVAAEAGSTVSGTDDICGTEAHAHTDACRTCGSEEHTHSQSCFSGIAFNSTITNSLDMNAIQDANANASSTEGAYLYFIQTSYDASVGRYWSKMLVNGVYWNVTINGTDPIYDLSSILSGSHDAEGTVDGYTAYRYPVNQLSSTNLTCTTPEHSHGSSCYTCGVTEHIHSDACSPNIAQYLDFVDANEDVVVAGDGTTTVNVYYTYRTYTIRFIYAKTDRTNYYLASLTNDGSFGNSQWGYLIGTDESVLPTVTDPSGATERTTFTRTEDGYTYYYISLTAKLGSDISTLWPANNVGTVGVYYWGSWAAAPDTGYRETYGDAHANIVGTYPIMSTDMVADDQELLEIRADGTKVYLAQNMIAWWADGSMNVANHAYHNYFEVIGETQDSDVEYNGKHYRLRETITFTAAHNGDTRVDPIKYSGFTCINDTTGTTNDTQANSQNFANNGTCEICRSTCAYCNTFYYDANVYTLKFYNYNDWLDSGSGVSVAYGTPLSVYEEGTESNEGATDRAKATYPNGLESGVYEFKGWYTTAECYDYSAVDWETITMPDSDLTVYAKWAPITHEVKIYITESGEQYGETITVTHDNPVPSSAQPDESKLTHPSDTSATFIGWFYKDDNGDEQAFDFANMTITADVTIYAKWRSNIMKAVEIYYVVKNDDGTTTQVADTEALMMRLGQTRTFEAKTGTSLYSDYRIGCFPTTASHSITIADDDIASSEPVTFTFEYKKYGSVPYQVEFYVQLDTDANNDGKPDLRPAYKVTGDKAEFVDADTYASWTDDKKRAFAESNTSVSSGSSLTEGGQYIEQHWQNNKAIVTELYVPDDLADATWTLPDAYLPNALKIQKIIVPSSTDPETNIEANVIQFIYTYTESVVDPDPDDPNNPGQVYKSKYLVQHYIQSVEYLVAEDKTGLDEYELYLFSNEEGYSGKTATASPISIPGYTYSYDVTNTNKQTGTALGTGADATANTMDDILSGTITADDSLELNFYYTVNSYPYQVMYLEQDTNRVLATTKETDSSGNLLTGLYGAKVTEEAIAIEGYDIVGSSEKTIYIQMEAGATASVNTITFYYKLKSAELVISKNVELDAEQADQEGISQIPSWVYDQEFTFTIYQSDGFPKSVYHYTFTGTDGSTEEKTVNAGVQTIQISLKHGETVQFHDFPMGMYTVTETYVPGFKATVDNYIAQTHTVTLNADGQTETLAFVNYFPFYTGDLVIKKNVTKLDESDPTATEAYKVTVVLEPDDSAREVDRPITFVDQNGNSVTDANGNSSFTIPKLTGTDDQTEFTIELLVPVDGEVKLVGVPVGSFTATEEVKGTIGYIYDFYTVKYNKAVHENDEVTGTNHIVTGSIHGGHPTAVTFSNTYKKGDLTIVKTVTQEYPNDNWDGDTFTFSISGTTELPDGTYHNIIVNGDESNPKTVTVTKGELTFTSTISVAKTDGATSWTGSLTFENLPAGYYTVTESAGLGNDKYTATTTTEPGTGLVNDTDTPAVFTFNNEYKRTSGNLQVSKEIKIVGEGHSIDGNQEFEFTVELTDGTLTDSYTCAVKETNGTADTTDDTTVENSATSLAVTDGYLTFTLKHNQYILIEGLPVGEYLVKEKNLDGYQSGFDDVTEQYYNGERATISNVDGSNVVASLACINRYPVNLATLHVKKIVEDSPENSDLDSAPTSDAFVFELTVNNYSALAKLDNIIRGTIYNNDGTVYPDAGCNWDVDNQKLTFQLLAGQYAVIQLPACTYTVKETALYREGNTDELADHYDTTFALDGITQVEGTKCEGELKANGSAEVTFTNTYKRHYADLKIIQSGMTSETDSGIYELVNSSKEVVVTVIITGNDFIIVEQVPVDEYTLREITSDWTWTYENSTVGSPTPIAVSASGENTVTFNHMSKHIDWLHHENAYVLPVSAAISLVNNDDENDGEGDDA